MSLTSPHSISADLFDDEIYGARWEDPMSTLSAEETNQLVDALKSHHLLSENDFKEKIKTAIEYEVVDAIQALLGKQEGISITGNDDEDRLAFTFIQCVVQNKQRLLDVFVNKVAYISSLILAKAVQVTMEENNHYLAGYLFKLANDKCWQIDFNWDVRGEYPFTHLCMWNDIQMVEAYINQEYTKHMQMIGFNTAEYVVAGAKHAAKRGYVKILECILYNREKLNLNLNHVVEILEKAIKKGQINAVKLILSICGQEILHLAKINKKGILPRLDNAEIDYSDPANIVDVVRYAAMIDFLNDQNFVYDSERPLRFPAMATMAILNHYSAQQSITQSAARRKQDFLDERAYVISLDDQSAMESFWGEKPPELWKLPEFAELSRRAVTHVELNEFDALREITDALESKQQACDFLKLVRADINEHHHEKFDEFVSAYQFRNAAAIKPSF